MTITVADIDSTRTLEIDPGTAQLPESVFLTCGDFCVELGRTAFLAAVKSAFHLVGESDEAARMLLADVDWRALS